MVNNDKYDKKRKRDSITDKIWQDRRNNKKMRNNKVLVDKYGIETLQRYKLFNTMISTANE